MDEDDESEESSDTDDSDTVSDEKKGKSNTGDDGSEADDDDDDDDDDDLEEKNTAKDADLEYRSDSATGSGGRPKRTQRKRRVRVVNNFIMDFFAYT